MYITIIYGKVKATPSTGQKKHINDDIQGYKSNRHIGSELTIPGKQLDDHNSK